MRGLFCIASIRGSLIITALLALPPTSFSEARNITPPKSEFQLISHTQTKPKLRPPDELQLPFQPKKLRAKSDLPSLSKLGVIIDASESAKRNNLEAIKVQPWTPGRGAIGVKLELTW